MFDYEVDILKIRIFRVLNVHRTPIFETAFACLKMTLTRDHSLKEVVR